MKSIISIPKLCFYVLATLVLVLDGCKCKDEVINPCKEVKPINADFKILESLGIKGYTNEVKDTVYVYGSYYSNI